MLAGILRFDVKPEHRDAFIAALVEHGRTAVPTEPQTRRFDVLVDSEDPNCILLYEAYVDTDAMGVHLAGPSHQQLVRTLSANDWLTTPLGGPPRPFAPFSIGRGNSVFTAEDASDERHRLGLLGHRLEQRWIRGCGAVREMTTKDHGHDRPIVVIPTV
jgi:(4S)-4-hydroxy-5-phosphonooxypentane-2,3-dione isomerase